MEFNEADDCFGKFQALHSRTFTWATLRRVYLAESFAEEKKSNLEAKLFVRSLIHFIKSVSGFAGRGQCQQVRKNVKDAKYLGGQGNKRKLNIFFGNGKISPVSNEMTNSLNHFVVCLYQFLCEL